jgi:hypothetical protein
VRESRAERARVVLRSDLLLELVQDRTGIEALVHPHHRHAGRRVPGEEGVLHRRGPSPAGQEREVEVDPPERAELERLARE